MDLLGQLDFLATGEEEGARQVLDLAGHADELGLVRPQLTFSRLELVQAVEPLHELVTRAAQVGRVLERLAVGTEFRHVRLLHRLGARPSGCGRSATHRRGIDVAKAASDRTPAHVR